MTLDSLALEEREVIRRAMEATFGYFDSDFQTRLGIAPESMRALLESWPTVDDACDDSDACLAVNNSLNELLHGVGIGDVEAMQLVGASREEMYRVYRKWAAARGWNSTGVR